MAGGAGGGKRASESEDGQEAGEKGGWVRQMDRAGVKGEAGGIRGERERQRD